MWNVYVVVDIYTQVGRIGRARPIATLLLQTWTWLCDGIESRFVACLPSSVRRANASKRIEKPFLVEKVAYTNPLNSLISWEIFSLNITTIIIQVQLLWRRDDEIKKSDYKTTNGLSIQFLQHSSLWRNSTEKITKMWKCMAWF